VTFKVVTPENITQKEKELFEKLKKLQNSSKNNDEKESKKS